jgi:hypothetical protein
MQVGIGRREDGGTSSKYRTATAAERRPGPPLRLPGTVVQAGGTGYPGAPERRSA